MTSFLKKFLIIFFIFFISASFFYENFYKPSLFLNITTPDGKNYTLSFNNLDLIRMSIYGVIRNINLEKGLNNTEKVKLYSEKLNDLIIKNKEYYNFYYMEFQKFYPERYFILCVEDSCSYFFFSISGLIHLENGNLNIEKPLIVWIDENYLNNFIKIIEKGDSRILLYLKEGIIKGYFKVTNVEKVVDRIIKEYRS
ncbi:MAG: hypothetical protein QW038_01445 [Nanopusillaceae archaeon]